MSDVAVSLALSAASMVMGLMLTVAIKNRGRARHVR